MGLEMPDKHRVEEKGWSVPADQLEKLLIAGWERKRRRFITGIAAFGRALEHFRMGLACVPLH